MASCANISQILAKCKHPNIGTTVHVNIVKNCHNIIRVWMIGKRIANTIKILALYFSTTMFYLRNSHKVHLI